MNLLPLEAPPVQALLNGESVQVETPFGGDELRVLSEPQYDPLQDNWHCLMEMPGKDGKLGRGFGCVRSPHTPGAAHAVQEPTTQGRPRMHVFAADGEPVRVPLSPSLGGRAWSFVHIEQPVPWPEAARLFVLCTEVEVVEGGSEADMRFGELFSDIMDGKHVFVSTFERCEKP